MQLREQTGVNWMPIGFNWSASGISVRWMDFGDRSLSEPFFSQTLKSLRRSSPGGTARETSLTYFLEAAAKFEAVSPSVVIFHVSRCGSTLVANVLKAGTECMALSEALPVGSLLMPRFLTTSPLPGEEIDGARKLLMDGILRIYGASFGRRIIVKCQAAPILNLPLARAVWPTTPFLIIIREPIEVMMSNLAKPAGWLRAMHRGDKDMFGLSRLEIQQMSIEEYCARGLTRFLKAILRQQDDNTFILDYRQLNVRNLYRLSQFLNITIPAPETMEIDHLCSLYSKDLLRNQIFEPDIKRKQQQASSSVRGLADKWPREPYEKLLKRCSFSSHVMGLSFED